MESYDMSPFQSGFFRLPEMILSFTMLYHVSILPFSWLKNIPLVYGYTTLRLSIHPWTDTRPFLLFGYCE